MSRLKHSYAGFMRAMEISSTRMFIFVEGTEVDPFFFGGLCACTFRDHLRYEVVTAKQLPGDSGGKQALLAFFIFLRQKNALISGLGNESTTSIFFLDKDVDDLMRKKRRSLHVVYTEYYDVQNYVFQYGDIVTGSASAASLDPGRLVNELGDSEEWCRRIAVLWRDWVALCLQVLDDGVPGVANYRIASKIQTRHCGATDRSKFDAIVKEIAFKSGVPEGEMHQRVRSAIKKVKRYYSKGEHHRLFKGKWYATALEDQINRLMAGTPYDKNGLEKRLSSAIASTLDFSEPWAEYFKHHLRQVAACL